MTLRPAFFPLRQKVGVDDTQAFEFTWNPGFAISQKQKNVRALHEAILSKMPDAHPLEISSKSTNPLGVRLSAFNLTMPYKNGFCSVESVFQASKVFESSGPFPELYTGDPRTVRDYVKSHAEGKLVSFDAHGVRWPLNPTRVFYDWIYIKVLLHNTDLLQALDEYDCFTDIEFNPMKSLNCQAYALALYLSLQHSGVLVDAMKDKDNFLMFHPQDIVVVGKGTNVHKAQSYEQETFKI